jgi:hypothetical protein
MVLVMWAIGADSARAGAYAMWNCNVPGHGNSPVGPWHLLDNYPNEVSLVDACAAGGGISFTVDDSQQLQFERAVLLMLERPTGPRSQVEFVKVTLWYAARLAGAGHPISFTSIYSLTDGSLHPGFNNIPPGSANLVGEQQLPPDTGYFALGIRCGPLDGSVQNPGPCYASNRVPLLIRGMEVTLSEDVPPTVQQMGGGLLEDGQQAGIRPLTFSAADPQSGLSKVEALLDGTVVASTDLTPRCAYSDFTVCPSSLDGTLHVDTHAVANGRHRLVLRVQDAAGNQRVVEGERVVDVANEPPKPGSALAPARTLIAKFNGTSQSKLTVPYGRHVTIRGRLSQSSQPMAGASIEILERLDRKGAHEKVAGRVDTEADGTFTALLRTTRPSRTVHLAFNQGGAERLVSKALRLRVRAASRLRASLRGRVVQFSGRVLSRPIPKRGKRVLMEGRSPGSAWTQFKSLHTDRNGRFSGTYRLRVRRPGVVLKIRALVPSEDGYGYVRSRSRSVALRVR